MYILLFMDKWTSTYYESFRKYRFWRGFNSMAYWASVSFCNYDNDAEELYRHTGYIVNEI